jgi:ribosomal protein S27AE
MPHLKSGAMAGLGIRGGRREAQENIEVQEEGDCPRCGGESQPSSMESYLQCGRCNYEWKDPNATSSKRIERPTYHQDSEMIDQFKQEMENGELSEVLGISKVLRTNG